MSIRVSTALSLDITTVSGQTFCRKYDRPIITVGKLSTCALSIDDAQVSRRHCVIERTSNGRWRLTDLGSTHGTQLNGHPTVQSWLEDGDTITVGRTQLHVSHTATKGDGDTSPSEQPACVPQTPSAEEMLSASVERTTTKAQGPPQVHISVIHGDTLVHAERYGARQTIRLGRTDDCQFFISESSLGRDFADLVIASAAGPALNLGIAALSGEVLHDSRVIDLDSLSAPQLPLEVGMRARLTVGDYTVLLSLEPQEVVQSRAFWHDINFTPANFILGSALLHIALLAFGAMMPEDPLRSIRDPMKQRQRLVKVMRITAEHEPRPVVEEPPPIERVAERDPLTLDDVASRPSDRPTKTVTERLVDKLRTHQNKRRTDSTLSHADTSDRKVARRIAKTTGVHAALGRNAALLSKVLRSTSIDATEVAWLGRGGDASEGELVSEVFGDNGAPPGPASWVNLPGGANKPLFPGGPLNQPRKRRSSQDPSLSKKTTVVPDVRSVVVSGRSKSQVAKRIRRYLSGIRWCLRSDLEAGTAQTGKAHLKFTIGPDGKVFGIKVKGSGSQSFRGCAKQKIARWRFGAVEAGGITKVSYPIILKVRN